MPNVVLNFSYDFSGNRTSLWDNLDGSTAYTYTDHRLTGLSTVVAGTGEEWTQLAVTLSYDSIGRLVGVTRSESGQRLDEQLEPYQYAVGDVETEYSYDLYDNLLGITHASVDSGVSTTLSEFGYTYDDAHQVVSYTGPDGSLSYAYDLTGQLTSVTGDRTESYSYDANGNRTMTGYVTGDGNRLESDGTYAYTYDNEGNLLTKVRISDGQRTEYTWDYRNRLTGVVVKDVNGTVLTEVEYTYDVDNRRIGQSVDGEQTWTVYDGPSPYADFDGNGQLTNRYLYGPKIDQLFARCAADGTVAWYLTDRLGSVRQLVATDGTVLDEVDYDSYGNIINETQPANGDRFKFTAREWDGAFDEYYFRARHYSPGTGRFIGQDPMGFAAGDANLSRYTWNSPTNWTDPTGLWSWGDAWFGGWGGVGITAGVGIAVVILSPVAIPGAVVGGALGTAFIVGFGVGGATENGWAGALWGGTAGSAVLICYASWKPPPGGDKLPPPPFDPDVDWWDPEMLNRILRGWIRW